MTDDAVVVVEDATFFDSYKRGLLAEGDAAVDIVNSTIVSNGGVYASEGGYGGTATKDSASVLLPSPGGGEPGNIVCENENNTGYLQLDTSGGGTVTVDSGNYVSDACP